jgi:hypothetical protein
MLNAIEIENFKAFGERTRVELAPITLIFGENSGGKSTILQVLSLLKQSYQNREQGAVLLPRVTGGPVDLGSYRNMVFDHDTNRKLSIRLDMDNPYRLLHHLFPTYADLGSSKSIGLQWIFGQVAESSAVELQTLHTFVDGHKVSIFRVVPEAEIETSLPFLDINYLTRFDSWHELGHFRIAGCTWIADKLREAQANFTARLPCWVTEQMCPHFLQLANAVNTTLCELDMDDQGAASGGNWGPQLHVEGAKTDGYRGILSRAFEAVIVENLGEDGYRKALGFPDSEDCDWDEGTEEDGSRDEWLLSLKRQTGVDVQSYISNAEKLVHGKVSSETINIPTAAKPGPDYFLRAFFDVWNSACIGMEGILPVRLPDTLTFISRDRDSFSSKYGGVAATVKNMTLGAADLFRSTLESIYPLGPYREVPQRLYFLSGATPHSVGDRGQYLPDLLLRRYHLLQQTNDWLDRLGIGYRVEPTELRSGTQDLFELRLFDLRRGTPVEVGLADVGFGVSQLLPLVVQSLASEKQIITIEQPEVHVHPRLQAEIADLLIEGIQKPRNHQFIVETHSEHLILRLLRRIRETHRGNLPEGHPGLTPDQLSVIYVQRTDSGSQAYRIDIDADGEFLQPWPDDFFELDFHERFA